MYTIKQGVELPKRFKKGNQTLTLHEDATQEELEVFWQDEGIRIYLEYQDNDNGTKQSTGSREGETEGTRVTQSNRRRALTGGTDSEDTATK